MGGVLQSDDQVLLGGYSFTFREASGSPVAARATAASYAPPATLTNYAEDDYYTPVWKRKSVQIVVVSLIVLIIAASTVYTGYHQTMAGKMFNTGMKGFTDKTPDKAIVDFKNFLESYPNDSNGDKGRIYLGLSKAHGLIQNGQQWEAALVEVEDTIKTFDRTDAFKQSQTTADMMATLLDVAKGSGDRPKMSGPVWTATLCGWQKPHSIRSTDSDHAMVN